VVLAVRLVFQMERICPYCASTLDFGVRPLCPSQRLRRLCYTICVRPSISVLLTLILTLLPLSLSRCLGCLHCHAYGALTLTLTLTRLA